MTNKPTATFCTGVEAIDFNPFEKLSDPRKIPMLSAVLLPYIPKTEGEPAILKSWTFSENGKVFTAKLSQHAKWQDGSKVSAKEAAFGIAKTITFRELGEKVKVVGTEHINSPGWQDKTYAGIKILDDSSFELRFESDIKNVMGVVREALSSGSRHNKMWPTRLTGKASNAEVVSKAPIHVNQGTLTLSYSEFDVELLSASSCANADLNHFVKFITDDFSNYTVSESHSKQSMIALTNPEKFSSPDARWEVANLLRSAMRIVPSPFPVQTVEGLFLSNEAGHISTMAWGARETKLASITKSLKFIPGNKNLPDNVYGKAIFQASKAAGIAVTWLSPSAKLKDADVFITPTRVEEGRLVWLQDFTTDGSIAESIRLFPKTFEALTQIKKLSAATIPADNETLQSLEKAAWAECSVIPVGRFGVLLFSKKSSPVEVVWSPSDELEFRLRGAK